MGKAEIHKKDNPYEVVKEEIVEETTAEGIKVTHKTGYDNQGRIVMIATFREYPDGSVGHAINIVNEMGYWEGGAYDPVIGSGCQFARIKFEGADEDTLQDDDDIPEPPKVPEPPIVHPNYNEAMSICHGCSRVDSIVTENGKAIRCACLSEYWYSNVIHNGECPLKEYK